MKLLGEMSDPLTICRLIETVGDIGPPVATPWAISVDQRRYTRMIAEGI